MSAVGRRKKTLVATGNVRAGGVCGGKTIGGGGELWKKKKPRSSMKKELSGGKT